MIATIILASLQLNGKYQANNDVEAFDSSQGWEGNLAWEFLWRISRRKLDSKTFLLVATQGDAN